MNWFGFILAQCLNALSQASILFFIACGLTLIFGIMRIVNFAHGVIFMLGAYVGYTANVVTGSFLVSLVVAPVVVGLVGMAFERTLLRHLYGRRDGGAYLLLTFGLAVVLSELIRLIWGVQPLGAGIPDFLRSIDCSSSGSASPPPSPSGNSSSARAPAC
jgi:branched-subunit amino acid ABC-type transport system permease component